MKNSSLEQRQGLHLDSMESSMDVPLWLLQKDDSRFLYFSLFLSLAVHIILFVVMAATRIFHPLAGTTLEFDLVWFSPAPSTVLKEISAPKPVVTKQIKIIKPRITPTPKAKLPTVKHVKAKTQPSPKTEAKAPYASNPPKTLPVAAQVQTSNELVIEEPSEMVISRFGGKVVEVVPKKRAIPSFTVISSVTLKSETARAVVQTIHETDTKIQKPQETKQPTKAVEATEVVALPKNEATVKQQKEIVTEVTPSKQTSRGLDPALEKPIQGKISSSSIASANKQPLPFPAVNRAINSLASAMGALTEAASKQTVQAQTPKMQDSGTTGTEKLPTLQRSVDTKLPLLPPSVEKPAVPEVKQAKIPQAPHMIFDSPLTGDLKLVITGDVDVKVETFFRPFPKNRRSKPFTRREAEGRQAVLSKVVRTKENVREAVLEITEEGIYFIVVRPGNGKQGTAELALKIRESRPGSTTKKLGSRKIDGTFEVVKVLMPEGILWNDDSYFSGNMEDADSITKFNNETGLMWREYK